MFGVTLLKAFRFFLPFRAGSGKLQSSRFESWIYQFGKSAEKELTTVTLFQSGVANKCNGKESID
jgi:hypothetical protein